MQPTLRQLLLLIFALTALVVLVYWPGLGGGFLFDDYPNIVQQERVQATELSIDALKKAAGAYTGGRQMAMASFAMDHALGGLEPRGYKITNLAIHALNTILVFFLARRLLRLSHPVAARGLVAPFAVAALWAVHPLQVSTVLYIVQRMEMLSYTFVLMALICYLRGRELQIGGTRGWHFLVLSALLAATGLLNKETALLFPCYAFVVEMTLLRFSAASPSTERMLKAGFAVGIVFAAVAFVFVAIPRFSGEEIHAIRDFGLQERLLTQLRVLSMYLGWIVIPQPGSYLFYYDNFPPSLSLTDPFSTLASGAFLLSLFAGAILARKRFPLAALGVLWFFTSHALTSNIVPVELAFEHRNYFGVLAVMLVFADAVLRLPASEIPRIRTVAVVVLIAGFGLLTLIRSAGWGNPLLLAVELAEKNPGSSRASTDLGEQFMIRSGKDPESEFYLMAQREFERGMRIPGSSPLPEQGLLILAATAGQPAKAEWWDSLIRKLNQKAIGPQEVTMMTGLLRMRGRGLEIDDERFAEAYLVLVNRLQMPSSQYFAFGIHALTDLGDTELARKLFVRAADRGRDNPDFVARMIVALAERGHPEQAAAMAEHARRAGIVDVDPARIARPASGP